MNFLLLMPSICQAWDLLIDVFIIEKLIVVTIKLVTVVEGDQKAPFSIATTPRCSEGHNSFTGIAPLYP